jgi:hypothetical protein
MPKRLADDTYLGTFIGLNFQEALYKAAREDFIVRVTKDEGKGSLNPHGVLTGETRTDRINVWLDKGGIVTKAYLG